MKKMCQKELDRDIKEMISKYGITDLMLTLAANLNEWSRGQMDRQVGAKIFKHAARAVYYAGTRIQVYHMTVSATACRIAVEQKERHV